MNGSCSAEPFERTVYIVPTSTMFHFHAHHNPGHESKYPTAICTTKSLAPPARNSIKSFNFPLQCVLLIHVKSF